MLCTGMRLTSIPCCQLQQAVLALCNSRKRDLSGPGPQTAASGLLQRPALPPPNTGLHGLCSGLRLTTIPCCQLQQAVLALCNSRKRDLNSPNPGMASIGATKPLQEMVFHRVANPNNKIMIDARTANEPIPTGSTRSAPKELVNHESNAMHGTIV